MKLINSSVELLPQEDGLEGIYKQIEKCGRICYKSDDKITEDSYRAFAERMIASNHTAMLEHGTVYLKVPMEDFNKIVDDHDLEFWDNPYTYFYVLDLKYMCISTNLRVLYEHQYTQLLDFVVNPSEEDFKANRFHKRITVKFICDRGVANELVRHRKFSFAQESSRYCNYSKDKSDNSITYIIPTWLTLNTGNYEFVDGPDGVEIAGDGFLKEVKHPDKDVRFLSALLSCENTYMSLINEGCPPEAARQVLPLATKTEICITGFIEDWKHFFDLRYFEKTGRVHPDMKKLTKELFELINF